MSNVDINVDRRTDGLTDGRTENRTPISHPATSRCDKNDHLWSFFHIIYTFLSWIQHACLANTVFDLGPIKCYKEVLVISNVNLRLADMSNKTLFGLFIFFFFFDLGFTALSRIFHLYRADRSSKVGENRRTRRKTTWPSVSRTWLSHIWPEPGSNHSGEKPNGLRVNSLIH